MWQYETTGCFHTVTNHKEDLAKLQSMVTRQSQRKDSPSPMYVVVIDELRVVNSSAGLNQLRELFQLTKVGHALLAVITI